MLEEGLACGVVGEGEVELLLCEGLNEFLVHLPGLIGGCNHGHAVFLLQDFLLVFGKHLP